MIAWLRIAVVVIIASLGAAPLAAQAQQPAPTPGNADEETSAIPARSLVWHPWVLFDPHLSRREFVVSAGPVSERAVGRAASRGGVEAMGGPTIETRGGPFVVRLQQEVGLRQTRNGEWAVALARYTYAAGLVLGPVELTGRAGLSLAEISFGSPGFGLAFLSPVAGAGASVRLGPVRVGALAYRELAWRWTSQPTSSVTGLLFEVALVNRSSGLPAYYRVEK